MLIGLAVTLLDDYTLTHGTDVSDAQWIDPATLSDEDARGSRSIVRFAHDPSHDVAFVREYDEKQM